MSPRKAKTFKWLLGARTLGTTRMKSIDLLLYFVFGYGSISYGIRTIYAAITFDVCISFSFLCITKSI